jgi:hypothetical protein
MGRAIIILYIDNSEREMTIIIRLHPIHVIVCSAFVAGSRPVKLLLNFTFICRLPIDSRDFSIHTFSNVLKLNKRFAP